MQAVSNNDERSLKKLAPYKFVPVGLPHRHNPLYKIVSYSPRTKERTKGRFVCLLNNKTGDISYASDKLDFLDGGMIAVI